MNVQKMGSGNFYIFYSTGFYDYVNFVNKVVKCYNTDNICFETKRMNFPVQFKEDLERRWELQNRNT